jgi:MFS family permease
MRDRPRGVVVAALGATQILAWGSSYYLVAPLAGPIAADTGWPLPWVVGGLSLGLCVAALVSPRMGRAIQAHGGRPVLGASSILLAAGLGLLAASSTLVSYFVAWGVLGAGMGLGLYDAAFATLGRLYGVDARRAITVLTLYGGFASTVGWPLSTALEAALGWRTTCLVYAGLQLLVALPVHLSFLPAAGGAAGRSPALHRAPSAPRSAAPAESWSPRRARLVVLLLGTILTLAAAIVAVVAVHVLGILRTRGLSLEAAVAIGALIGPSQVAARVVEMLLERHHHPIWTLVASIALMALGLVMLATDFPLVALATVIYAAGVGIESIARGTLPLALFGPASYALLMGRLATPILLAQAIAPPAAAGALLDLGTDRVLLALAVAGIVNVVLAAILFALCVGGRGRVD